MRKYLNLLMKNSHAIEKKKISEKKKQIINSLREFAQQIKLFVCMTDGRRHLRLYCHRHQSINQQGKKNNAKSNTANSVSKRIINKNISFFYHVSNLNPFYNSVLFVHGSHHLSCLYLKWFINS